MSIAQEQIKNIIKNLSKLSYNENDKQIEDLEKIIDYMGILSEVDTTGVEPTVSVGNTPKNLREDNVLQSISPDELLACSQQSVIARQIALSNIMH